MKKMLLNLYVSITQPVKNERGAQSLEWLGLAALLILVLSLVSTAVNNGGSTITSIITNILNKINAMVG